MEVPEHETWKRNLLPHPTSNQRMSISTATDTCYWTATARDPSTSALRGELKVDVAIVGAGIVGSIAARLLKDRGHSVALVEGGRAGHGATGRSTAKVTAQHALFLQRIERDHGLEVARSYATANRAGLDLIANLIARHRLACDFERTDSFVYALTAAGKQQIADESAAAERAGLPMEILSETELPYPVTAALRLADQAQFHPVDFVTQLAATIAGEGSFTFERSPVIDWSETSVRTPQGSISAERVIMATHLPLGQIGQLHAYTHPHMHCVIALPVDAGRAPIGMYITADEPKRSIRRHATSDGETMLILTGPTFKHGDVAAEKEGFAELATFAREHFGCARGGFRWTNEDYAPQDGLPYVGWSGAHDQSVLVATGFDAWGLSNGAAAAVILADLCEGRENEWAHAFDASRHSLRGVGKLVANAGQTASELVGEHLRERPAPTPGDLCEGEVVDIGGRTAGLYRDDGGGLRAVSAVCTHMGCIVGWNPVDRTWDCPCHGSRFASDGQVLHGPAVEPLATLDWSANRS